MKVASAGQCVNSASNAMAGSSRSQPWMVAVRREVISWRSAFHPSWPGLTRPSTTFSPAEDVDARDKPGHDEG
jgi:hypothetical protein